MATKYPQDIDTYTTKQDVVLGQEDTTGDYVEAAHVNDLQDAVESIEQILGKNPQGSSLTISDRIANTSATIALKTPSLCVYYGDPFAFNWSTSDSMAVNEFLYYDNIVFKAGLEDPSGTDYTRFQAIINQLRSSRDLKIYGTVDIGMTTGLTQEQIELRIARWDTLGVDGIFLDNFGYDKLVTRDRQNNVVNFCHARGLVAFIRATNYRDVFESDYDATYNASGTNPVIEAGDIYLHENFMVNTTDPSMYVDSFDTANALVAYRKAIGVKIFGVALINSSLETATGQNYFDYAQAGAVLYSYDAFYSMTEAYGAITNANTMYQTLSLLGNYYDRDPQIIHSNTNTYYRVASFGKITVDKNNHEYRYSGIAVPGDSIYGDVNVDAIVNTVIQAINANLDKVIDADKIAALTADHIKAIVIEAINDTVNDGEAIDGARIGNLTANHITTGDIAADRMMTNVIQAINAYVGDIKINQARIDYASIGGWDINTSELTSKNKTIVLHSDSDHDYIRASSKTDPNKYVNIDSDGLSVEKGAISIKMADGTTTILDGAGINGASISVGDIHADRLQANIVQAINFYVSQLNTEQINTGVVSADAIRSSVIDAINANVGAAVIGSAKIGQLDASKITSGSISSSLLTANVIDAINANVGHASIDGAVIGDATIDGAQIIDASIGTAHIQNGSITSAKIGSLQVEESHIVDGSITNAKIANLSVNDAKVIGLSAEKITAGYLDAARLKAGVITADKIATGAITAESGIIANAAITSAMIGSGVIGNAHIANGSIDAAKIATASIGDAQIGSISANKITSGTLDSSKVTISTGGTAKVEFTGSGLFMVDSGVTKVSLTPANGLVIAGAAGMKLDGTGSIIVGGDYSIVIDRGGIKAKAGGSSDYTNFFDSTGIRTLDPDDSNNQLIMRSGELIITTDGGLTATTAITKDGIYGTIITDHTITSDKFDTTPPDVPTWGTTPLATDLERTAETTLVTVTLNWNQVDDTDLQGYKIYGKEGLTGTYYPLAIVGKVTTHKLTSLKSNTRYYFIITSYDLQGNECSKVEPGDNTLTTYPKYIDTAKDVIAPHAPSTPIVTAGFKMVSIDWDPVTTNSDNSTCYDLDHYRVTYASSVDGYATWSEAGTIKGTFFIARDLDYETIYKFKVYAVDSSGNESAGSESSYVQPTKVGGTDIVANSITTEHIAASGISADIITSGTIRGGLIDVGTITADRFESKLYGDITQATRYVQSRLTELIYQWDNTNANWLTGTATNIEIVGDRVCLQTVNKYDSSKNWDTADQYWDNPAVDIGTWESPVIDLGELQTLFNMYRAVTFTQGLSMITVYVKYSDDNVTWSEYDILTGTVMTCRYFQFKIELRADASKYNIRIDDFSFEFYADDTSDENTAEVTAHLSNTSLTAHGTSTSSSITVGGLTVNGDIATTGTVDGVDISTFKTDYDTFSTTTVPATYAPLNAPTLTGEVIFTGSATLKSGDSTRIALNSGGSIELGDSANTGGVPYIDFHYGTGTAQDFNTRIINDANNRLSVRADSGYATLLVYGEIDSTGSIYPNGTVTKIGTASTSLAFGAKVSTDTVERFAAYTSGKLEWGDGTSTRDTNLYRASAGVLQTDGTFNIIKNYSGTALSLQVSGETIPRFSILTRGEIDFSDGTTVDCYFRRSSAKNLETDSNIKILKASAGSAISTRLSTDTNYRFVLSADGAMQWGDGTNAYDVSLVRSSAGTLYTSNLFKVVRTNATDNSLITTVSGDTNQRFTLLANGTMRWGDGTNAYDASIARNSAGKLQTDSLFSISRSGLWAFSTQYNTDPDTRFLILTDGKLLWGDGTNGRDTSLYRSQADELKTDDSLNVVGNIIVGGTVDSVDIAAFKTSYDSLTTSIPTTYAPLASPTFTGTVTLPSTTSIGNVSDTELGYLDGVTSNIQTQIDAKAPLASPSFTGTISTTGSITATESGSSSVVLSASVSGDTRSRFQVTAAGVLEWGAGGTSYRDVNLYRNDVDVLKTDDKFVVGGGTLQIGASGSKLYDDAGVIQFVDNAETGYASIKVDDLWVEGNYYGSRAAVTNSILIGAVTGEGRERFTITAGGSLSWSDGTNADDVNLYRGGTNTLRTDDTFAVYRANADDVAFLSCVNTEGYARFYSRTDGLMAWGPGSTGTADIMLYRSGTSSLTVVGSNFTSNARFNIYRTTTSDTALSVSLSTDSYARFGANTAGVMSWGDGTAAGDTNLYRSAANTLRTDDSLSVGGDLTFSAKYRLSYNSTEDSLDFLYIG